MNENGPKVVIVSNFHKNVVFPKEIETENLPKLLLSQIIRKSLCSRNYEVCKNSLYLVGELY